MASRKLFVGIFLQLSQLKHELFTFFLLIYNCKMLKSVVIARGFRKNRKGDVL